MKKSTALLVLKEEVKAIIYLYQNNSLDYDESAKLLLNCIEHTIGMKPPRITDVPEHKIMDLGKHKWEDEE